MYNENINKIFIFLLIFALVLNVTMQPIKSTAAAVPLSIAVGGTAKAVEILGFILAMGSLGIKYLNAEETVISFDDYKAKKDIKPLDPNPPPEDPNNRDWLRYLIGSLTGITMVNSTIDWFTNVKDFLTDIFGSLSEGLNTSEGSGNAIYNDVSIITTLNLNEIKILLLPWGVTEVTRKVDPNGGWGYRIHWKTTTNLGTSIGSNSCWGSSGNIEFKSEGGQFLRIYYEGYGTNPVPYNGLYTYLPVQPNNLFITNNAPILQPALDPTYPLPVPQLPDISTNPSINDDKERIGFILMPDGTTQKVFKGDPEEYIEWVVDNMTFDEIMNAPTTVTTPATDPQGNNVLVIDPDTANSPFPNPITDPPADTLTGLGVINGLIQTIINWLSQIYNAIISIPENILNGLKDLFIVPDGYWRSAFERLRGELEGKIFDDDALSVIDSMRGISPLPIPDLMYKDNVILKAEYANNMAPYIKNWLEFFIIMLMALMNLNNFYKLIRGHDLISIGGGPKDDNSRSIQPYN